MFDLVNNTASVLALAPQTITSTGSPQGLVGPGIDLQFFESAKFIAVLGDIDELGSSPVGSSKIEMELEHSDDNSTWTDVVKAETVGALATVTNGIVASSTTDTTTLEVGYVGGKRYARMKLLSTSLTNGGPVAGVCEKGNPRHAPV